LNNVLPRLLQLLSGHVGHRTVVIAEDGNVELGVDIRADDSA
jgi:hypothetical protein